MKSCPIDAMAEVRSNVTRFFENCFSMSYLRVRNKMQSYL
jgi:hypothetical protein